MIGSQMINVIKCFMSDVPNKQAKRHSIVEGNVTRLVYYSSTIAKRENNRLSVTLDGFNTASTRLLLNQIPGVDIRFQKGELTLNGEAWNGEWRTI
jgi:hypothetical protein